MQRMGRVRGLAKIKPSPRRLTPYLPVAARRAPSSPTRGEEREGTVSLPHPLLRGAPTRYLPSCMFVLFGIVLVDLIGFGIVIPLLPFFGERFGASPLTVTLLM